MTSATTSGGLDRVGVEAVVAGISQYVQDANRYNQATGSMGASNDKIGSSFKSGALEAVKFGAAIAGVQLGVQAAAATFHELIVGSVNAAIGFESSFTKIRQVANLTDADFTKLAADNRELAKTWPVNVEQINLLTARGAELGVKGVDGLNKFATTMIKAQLATGVAAIDLATGLEQLRTTFGGQETDIERYASVLTALQKDFGAGAPNVLAFASDIEGVGKAAGLTADQVLAIAAAAVSVGSDSSFAFTTLLNTMNKAASGDADALSLVSQVSGKSAAQFIKDWKTDAAGAFAGFVTGLGRQGPDALQVLDKLGIGGGRSSQGILALAAQGDRLPAIFAAATKELAANEAVNTDAARAAETHASKIQILQNKVHDLQITAGDALLEGIGPLVDRINDWLKNNGSAAAEGLQHAIEAIIDPIARLLKLLDDIDKSTAWKILTGQLQIKITPGGPNGAFDAQPPTSSIDPNSPAGQALARRAAALSGSGSKSGTLSAAELAADRAALRALPSDPTAPAASTGGGGGGGGRGLDFTTQADIKAAEAAEKQRIAEINRLVQEAKTAKDKADQEDISRINALGSAIEAALRKQAETQLQVITNIVDEKRKLEDTADAATVKSIGVTLDAQLSAIDIAKQAYQDAHTARLRQIDDEHTAAVDAITDTRDKTVKGLQDQIDAIQDLGKVDQRAALERQLALTYDATERKKIEDQITALNRTEQIDALRSQIDEVKTAAQTQIDEANTVADARKRALEDEQVAADRSFTAQADAARDSAAAQVDAEKGRHDAVVASLELELKQAKDFHDAQTADSFLQAKTRNMIANGEAAAIAALLESQGETYRAAGQSLGESFRHGLEQGGGAAITQALGGVPGTSQNASREVGAGDNLAFQKATYSSLKAGGAAPGILDLVAKTITDAGGVPPMASGLRAGEVQRTMLALLHPHEVVVNRSQAGLMAAAQNDGITFGPESFARMFDGATFAGSPEENMRAAQSLWREMLAEQLGRDAFLAGAGR